MAEATLVAVSAPWATHALQDSFAGYSHSVPSKVRAPRPSVSESGSVLGVEALDAKDTPTGDPPAPKEVQVPGTALATSSFSVDKAVVSTSIEPVRDDYKAHQLAPWPQQW